MSVSVSVLWVDFLGKILVHFSLVIQHNCQQQKDNKIRTTTSLPQTGNKVDSLIVDKFLHSHPFLSDDVTGLRSGELPLLSLPLTSCHKAN